MRSILRAVGSMLVPGLLGIALWVMPAGAAPFAYVTNRGSDTVSVLDTASNTVIATVPVGLGRVPEEVAITPDGAHAYVTNGGFDTVSVIATATNTVVTTIPVGTVTMGVAITPDGTHAYVVNQVPTGQVGSVLVLDTASNTVVTTVPVGVNPSEVAITPDGAHAYVTNVIGSTVSVIATATNTVVATVPVEHLPLGVAITPDGGHAYVTNVGSTVSVIATATNTVITTIPVGTAPLGVAITPDGAHAYVTNFNDNTVSVIATATNMVVVTISVGPGPAGVAITPDGVHAYVANNGIGPGSNTVSVIATATNTVVATVPVGTFPFGVAITPGPVTPFAAFTARVEIELRPRRDDAFAVQSSFTLGTGNNGVRPLTEDVKLELTGGTASFTTTIPAGSFTKDKQKRFEFEGTINGVDLAVKITQLGGNRFGFKVEGEHADLTSIANPVTVTLTIGDDTGSTTVRAKFDHRNRGRSRIIMHPSQMPRGHGEAK